HVEVRSPPQHARVFNLGDAEVQEILKPWIAGLVFEFGEQEWEPRESKLTILEGRPLDGPDLAFGQGWSNALRSAEDVTRRLIDSAETEAPLPPVVLVEADSVEEAAAAIASGKGSSPIEWVEARQRIDGRDPEIAAVVLITRKPEPGSTRS
ncbi:MAG TPA: hypothetical protein VLK56_00085, partial [Solirubrobacterales bacterium]|nr:hypothetical protein [Solirubrobacterales bacterium]